MPSKGSAAERYIAEQPADKRALLETLHGLVVKRVPDADICALASFKEHVGIHLFAPPAALVDPGKKLEGSGKSNRMLKVRSAADIDAASILRWLKAAVAAAS